MILRTTIRRFATGALIALASGMPAWGQSTDVLVELEARLSSDSFAERESASRDLLDEISVSDADLLQLCIMTQSPEVRRRALAIHRARFFASPRPAIGVTFANAGGLPMIERIHDGFPAGNDGTLRAGDIIVAVAGIRLNPMPSLARDELRPLIFSHNPYETVELTVYRPQNPEAQARLVAEVGGGGIPNPDVTLGECPEGYETLQTKVQLGEWSMLETNTAMSAIDRSRAWDALLARMNFRPAELEMVVRDESPTRNVSFHGRVVQALDIRFPFLARAAFFPSEENPPGFRNQAVIAKQLRNVAIQRVRVQPGAMPGAGEPGQSIVIESVRTADDADGAQRGDAASRAAREITALQSRILELSAIATDPGTSAAERAVAETAIETLRGRLSELRERLNEDAK
jgi:hypothetical protein